MGRHWDGWGYPHLAIKEGFIQMRQIRCGGRSASKFIKLADTTGFAFQSSIGHQDFSFFFSDGVTSSGDGGGGYSSKRANLTSADPTKPKDLGHPKLAKRNRRNHSQP